MYLYFLYSETSLNCLSMHSEYDHRTENCGGNSGGQTLLKYTAYFLPTLTTARCVQAWLRWLVHMYNFCSVSSGQRPRHALPATSAPSPGRASEPEQGPGCALGSAELRTSISSQKKKNLHSLPQALAFLAELHRGSSEAPRLKSAV